jgi:hypothetical protein
MKPLVSIVGSLVALSLLAGCGGGGSDTNSANSVDLDVINVKYGAPGMSVVLDGNTAASGEGYGKRTVFRIAPGAHTLGVRQSDKSVLDYSATPTLAAGAHQNVIVTSTGFMTDDSTSMPTASQCSIRFAAARNRSTHVDVYITSGVSDLSLAAHKFTNVAFKDPVQEVLRDLGRYRVIVTETGTNNVIADSGALLLAGATENLFVTQLGTTSGATDMKQYITRH